MKRRHPIRKIIGILLIVLLYAAASFGILIGVKGYRMYEDAISQMPLEDRVESIREGEDFTHYSELTEFYIKAVISVEDHRFMNHFGLDPVAICRAAWRDIRAGSFKEGGSTITQQLAKNMLFTQEKTVERKVAEIFAVFDIEEEYSKEEIFELYVNTSNFGSGYNGIYAASIGYFDKLPSELSDYESAVLAGVPNAPSLYSPDVSLKLASQRVGEVLQSMVREKTLTQEEADKIQNNMELEKADE